MNFQGLFPKQGGRGFCSAEGGGPRGRKRECGSNPPEASPHRRLFTPTPKKGYRLDPEDNTPKDKVRVTAELSPRSQKKLAELRERLGLKSNVEVIRRALSLLHLMSSEVGEGGHVTLTRAKGDVLLIDPLLIGSDPPKE